MGLGSCEFQLSEQRNCYKEINRKKTQWVIGGIK
jgi:hypothetical protein